MTFIAGGIEAMSGVDIMDGALGAYASAIGATKELLARGCRDIADYLGSAFEEIPPSMGRRGDVGLIFGTDVEGMPAAVLFIDRGVIGRAPIGLRRLPRHFVSTAFRIE